MQPIHVDRLCGVFAHRVHAQILYVHILHGQVFVTIYLIYAVGHAALHVLHVYVAYLRNGVLVGGHEVFPLVEHVGVDGKGTLHTVGTHAFHIYILDERAPAAVGFQVEERLHAVVHGAVVHIDIAYSARNLAAHNEQTVGVAHAAVAHHNVFRWLSDAPGIVVATRLYHHSVIALVKQAVLNEHIAGHFEVYTVVVMTVSIHVKTARHTVNTAIEMDSPEGRLAYLEVFEQHVAALVEVNQVRAQVVVALSHLPLGHRLVESGPVVELRQSVHVCLRA